MMLDSAKTLIGDALVGMSRRWQLNGRLYEHPELWGLNINDLGHLSIDAMDTIDLIKEHHTPLLVVNQRQLLKDAQDILKALSVAPAGSKVVYSYKTNCIPGILKEIHSTGIGAEVISPYELWLALKLKISGDEIVYNGVDKSLQSIEEAINAEILAINIDSKEEYARIEQVVMRSNKKAGVGIRLGMVRKSQFGLDIDSDEPLEICKKIAERKEYFNLRCIHFNVTSNAKNSAVYKNCATKALNFIKQIKETFGFEIEYLDIGGGIGVPTSKNMSGLEYAIYRTFAVLPKPPSVQEFQPIEVFLKDIVEHIKENCIRNRIRMPKIIIEPGRYVTSRAEFLLAGVQSVKEKSNGLKYAITDAGRLSVTFPCDFEYHETFVANKMRQIPSTIYHVMGRVCTSADWMIKNRLLPQLRPGDIIAVMDAGAYFSSYSTNFAFPRPKIISIENNNVRTLRERETYDYLTELDHI